MKFGRELAAEMVQEWQEAYMDYKHLKKLLKDIFTFRHHNNNNNHAPSFSTRKSFRKRKIMHRVFSGLTGRPGSSPRKSSNDHEVILVGPVQKEGSVIYYQTMFLRSFEEGSEFELVFFKKLDEEFNKVLRFYETKVEQVREEAKELNKQMDTLVALRIKVVDDDNNFVEDQFDQEIGVSNINNSSPFSSFNSKNQGRVSMDVIEEVEMSNEQKKPQMNKNGTKSFREFLNETNEGGFSLDVIQEVEISNEEGKSTFKQSPKKDLDHVKINVEPDTPVSTLRTVIMSSSKPSLSFSKDELRKAEEKLKRAFVEFHHKLRLLKSYCLMNTLAFTKIMKKYDKTTSRNASTSYLAMVDQSFLGSSDEVNSLIKRLEASFIKHFTNGNRRKGMKFLRPIDKKEKHLTSFSTGLFAGCSIALIGGISVSLHARELLDHEGRGQYMDNIFPLYSFFAYIFLHMVMYGANTYFWRRFRVNYPFIFGFKQGTELGFREILLLASGISVLTFSAVLSTLDMDMDPETQSFRTIAELVPLILVAVVLVITFCPLNIIYRSSRFFLIRSAWRCICAPLYKVAFVDFFLADQLTSQIQAIRSLQFYICYYGWGDFKRRSNKCLENETYQHFYIIVAIIPFWLRFLQCIRRLVEERNAMQGLNGLKYFSTVIALVMRTMFELRRQTFWRVMAASTSGITTIYNTYWDIVMDWGLFQRKSKNNFLRNKLLIQYKSVYYVAIVVNILLRLVWMQLVLDFNELPFLHRRAMVTVVACLEILRRGIWNFFRLENEHFNNVGNYRAFNPVALPFYYEDEKTM
ncbi:hypothetical protein ABFX02_11G117300 [Erythranthe guttata]